MFQLVQAALKLLETLTVCAHFIKVLPSLISVVKKTLFLEFFYARRRASAQGVQVRLQKRICPLCNRFCRLICVRQNPLLPFCQQASGVLLLTLGLTSVIRIWGSGGQWQGRSQMVIQFPCDEAGRQGSDQTFYKNSGMTKQRWALERKARPCRRAGSKLENILICQEEEA